MEFHRRRTVAVLVAAGVGVMVALAGCSTEFPDDTAEVRVEGRTITFELEACGLDDDTVFLVGRADGEVLQAVVGVEPDDDGFTAIPEASGLSYTDDGREWAAFGELSWSLRDGQGQPPGDVADVEIDGSRIALDASVVTVDGTRVVDSRRLDVTLEARCDAQPTA